jgi:manganese/zinc/iron transport system permease protein
MLGIAALGAAAGLIGSFATLRRRALMGDVLSHATLPGLCAAFLASVALGGSGRAMPILLLGAVASGVLGVLAVHALARTSRLPEDAAMGAVLASFFGLGTVLLSHVQTLGTGAEGGITKLIYGQAATMSAADAQLIALTAAGATLACALLFKELRLIAFDPGFAAAQGWPVGHLDLALMALIVSVTVVGLQAVGLIMVVALLIVPAAAARFWTERLSTMALAAAAIGAVSGYLGAAASALFPSFPAGAVIVLTAGAVFLASFLLAPRRGLIGRAVRHLGLRVEVGSEHVLRGAFEMIERAGLDRPAPIPPVALLRLRRWSATWLWVLTTWLRWRGLVRRTADGLVLTPAGLERAHRLVRRHRLWEQFLVSHADLAPSHVDRAADIVEHVLSAEMIAELERALAARGRLPRAFGLPASVHPIPEAPELARTATAHGSS